MDDDRFRPPPDGTGTARPVLRLLLGAALLAVAALTLTPDGRGWAWGSPVTELRWYAGGLDSATTMVQLLGNLGLLVVPGALMVLLWPASGRPDRLAGAALAAGAAVELLQWALPLGRVVSPLDAVLNAVGAVAAGLLVRHVRPGRARPSARSALTAPAQGRSSLLRHN
jgi:hypothetical protein